MRGFKGIFKDQAKNKSGFKKKKFKGHLSNKCGFLKISFDGPPQHFFQQFSRTTWAINSGFFEILFKDHHTKKQKKMHMSNPALKINKSV